MLLTPIFRQRRNIIISEIDIRDWQDNISVARDIINPDCHNPDDNPFGFVDTTFMLHFIDKVEALVVSDTKQVAALFKAKS